MDTGSPVESLSNGLSFLIPEVLLVVGLFIILIIGLVFRKDAYLSSVVVAVTVCLAATFIAVNELETSTPYLFGRMLQVNEFARLFGILANVGALLTIIMTRRQQLQKPSEYVLLLLTVVFGAHTLVMSQNFVAVLLSLELISLSSYTLTGWTSSKLSAEGSLKYFLFGSVATGFMVYGISIIYSSTGTFDFSGQAFAENLVKNEVPVLLVGGLLILAGFLFKIAAVPLHVWTPDVYQSAPLPVVAFFSVVPKLAGLGALVRFVLAIHAYGQTMVDWQWVLALLSILTMVVGNFSALRQTNPRRLLAYSSIAQSGFLLVGAVSMSLTGIQALLFYSFVLLVMNFLTFACLQQFEEEGLVQIQDYSGRGKQQAFRSVAMTLGLISLAGLPITAGFSAKLFIFSGLYEAYTNTHKSILLVLLVIGLLNTVVALFYYLRIPFQLFVRDGAIGNASRKETHVLENLFALILVILILALFFRPDLLMGWINKVSFVL